VKQNVTAAAACLGDSVDVGVRLLRDLRNPRLTALVQRRMPRNEHPPSAVLCFAGGPMAMNCQRSLVGVGRSSAVYFRIIYVGFMKSSSEILADVAVFISPSCFADFLSCSSAMGTYLLESFQPQRCL